MSTNKQPKEGDLMVWHIPQVPMKAFEVPVKSAVEGKRILDILADYDLFQFENKVKPDYTNVGGLNVFEDGEWVTWYDHKGNAIDELEFNDKGVLVPNI